MHLNSLLIFNAYAVRYFQASTRVLEIGPNKFPSGFQRAVGDKCSEWHTLDMGSSPELTYPNSEEYRFAIPDDRYDIVVSGNVLEHVRKPWRWLPEVARVTRPRGLVITIIPVSWPYHEAPVDCWRAYPEGMNALYEEAGLEVLVSEWESLEMPGHARGIPGVSFHEQGWIKRQETRLRHLAGRPVEKAFDTIAIGRKLVV